MNLHSCLYSPEMMPLDFHLFNDWHIGAHDAIIKTSHLPPGPPDKPSKYGRYGAGTPTALSETLRYAWDSNPSAERIVEDVTRWPTTIELIIQHKGCVIPDALIQHAGCSKTKRKGSGDVRRIGQNPEIAHVARERQKVLRSKAQAMARS